MKKIIFLSVAFIAVISLNTITTKGEENIDFATRKNETYFNNKIKEDLNYVLMHKYDDTNDIRLNEIESINYIDDVLNKTAYSNKKMDVSNDEIMLLARLINSEAGIEPYDGKIAVGSVIVNRMNIQNRTLEQIIFAKGQFDGTKTYLFNENPNTDCINAAIEVLSGNVNLPKNTYFFADLNLCSPDWARKDKFVTRIGDHWFFLK